MKRVMVLLAMLTLGSVAPRMAAAECCHCCGCQCQCSKVCKLVPDVKKEAKVCYECKCEDFCIPGKSCIIGYQKVPHDCTCGDRLLPEPIWQPSCGCVKTRKKLVKIETIKEIKGYKCVVVKMCPHCQALDKKGELPAEAIAKIEALGNDPNHIMSPATAMLAKAQPQQPAAEQPSLAQQSPSDNDADEADAYETQLVSHSATPAENPSLISRLKTSILGSKGSN